VLLSKSRDAQAELTCSSNICRQGLRRRGGNGVLVEMIDSDRRAPVWRGYKYGYIDPAAFSPCLHGICGCFGNRFSSEGQKQVRSAESEPNAVVAGGKDRGVNLHVRRFNLFCCGCANPAFSP
jgi:hypothetical protein